MEKIRPIDANAAIEKLLDYVTELDGDISRGVPEDDISYAIDEVPTLDYAPVIHAHWIYDPNAHDYNLGGYICSNCKEINKNLSGIKSINPMMFKGSRFCPNCGAIMDGDAEKKKKKTTNYEYLTGLSAKNQGEEETA